MKPLLHLLMFSFVVAGVVTGDVAAQEETEQIVEREDFSSESLPLLEDLAVPEAEDLLVNGSRDWMVLDTEEVIVIQPVVNRPNALERRRSEIAEAQAKRGQNFGAARDALEQEIRALNDFQITLFQNPDRREFQIPVRRVKEILYYETLCLKRIELLTDPADLNHQRLQQADELLMRVQRLQSGWPGLSDVAIQLLSLNVSQRMADGQYEMALALLKEWRSRVPNSPQIRELTGTVVREIAIKAIERSDFIRAQYHLRQLNAIYPDHPVFTELASSLTQQAVTKMQQAIEAYSRNEFRAASISAENAITVWPPAQELKGAHGRITSRYQRLHVGVTELPGECIAYPIPSAADLRVDELTTLRLFEFQGLRDGTSYYGTRFLDAWEPRDLGRKVHFTLRQLRQPSDSHGVITSAEVISPLLRRLDPEDPAFDERLASIIQSVDVHSPIDFTLAFHRVPDRIESLLATISLDNDAAQGDPLSGLKDPGGFRIESSTPGMMEYVRKLPEPDSTKKYHIAEVVEHRFDSPQKAVQAFRRGEVSMLVGLPDVEVRTLQADRELSRDLFFQKSILPETHFLLFNSRSEILRHIELRKALTYSIDSERILKEIVLEDPKLQHGRLVTTPFYSGHLAVNRQLIRPPFDISRGFALTLAARQKLNQDVPPLTMIVAPGVVAQSAAAEIVNGWRRIGIEVNIVAANAPLPKSWDILYRTAQITEPTLEMWPLLTASSNARISDLSVHPDWLKQELVQIERTGDHTRSIELFNGLQQHLQEHASFIPLWEVDQYFVLRKSIRNMPEVFSHPYDNIDQWTIDPWYQESLP
ncbi:ABC transporter substrate-binding protein [Planctomicrobium sp. SH668]|uniref:ABC transporter substrate-binding protein n=1 Tax=Planctomicrobium sp. SH668 TaxID=3448126 RepID=UPI003F5C8142